MALSFALRIWRWPLWINWSSVWSPYLSRWLHKRAALFSRVTNQSSIEIGGCRIVMK